MHIDLSLDNCKYTSKPDKDDARDIRKRIGGMAVSEDLRYIAEQVGEYGRTFSPQIFQNGWACNKNAKGQQLFVLDFDSGLTTDEFFKRIEMIGIPVCFVYRTFSDNSPVGANKFRAVFLHECQLKDPILIYIVQTSLMRMFLECDRSCKDISRMYYGGKELLYFNECSFSITSLGDYLRTYFYLKDSKHWHRDFENFVHHKLHVQIIGDRILGIRKSGEKSLEFSTIYIEKDRESEPEWNLFEGGKYNILLYNENSSHKENDAHKSAKDNCLIKGKHKPHQIPHDKFAQCRLLKDFLNGETLQHAEKYLISSNLRFVEGGVKVFLNQIQDIDGEEKKKKWHYDIKQEQEKESYQQPQKCSLEKCRYYEDCKSSTIIKRISERKHIPIERIENEVFVDINTAERHLSEALSEAINQPKLNGFYFILAQTALGKSHCYIRSVIDEFPNTKFIIAVPTVELRDEIGKKIKSKFIGEDTLYITPSIKDKDFPALLRKQLEIIQDQGLYSEKKDIINEYLEKENNEFVKSKIQEWLDHKEKEKSARIILTTHAHLLAYDEQFLRDYTIIIDEDILTEYIFKQVITVDLEDVVCALQYNNLPMGMRERFQYIQNNKDKFGIFNKTGARGEYLNLEEMEELGITSNLNDINKATSYYKGEDQKGQTIMQYFCPKELVPAKYIVLSATADPEVYKEFFKNILIRMTWNIPKVRYQGNLIQYTKHSLGRSMIDDDIIRSIDEIVPNDFVKISFKMFGGKCGIEKYNYYGNLTGLNKYENTNLCLIGTPFIHPNGCKLPAIHIQGYVGDIGSDVNQLLTVDYNGYRFGIMTFHNRLLQRIHLYMIRDLLEQSVGRARLLRKNNTVVLFSSFPCDQAEFHQEEYLRKDADTLAVCVSA